MPDNDSNVAIYLDFENLAIAARNLYPEVSKPLKIEHLVDFATNKGDVCIKKAYADWSKEPNSRYTQDLIEYAFELIHLPRITFSGKNAADIRMTMDAMEDMVNSDIVGKLIIGSGDTDFVHLIRKIQEKGREAIVVGFDQSVGRIIKDNCNEFKSIEELMGEFKEELKKEEEDVEEEEDKGREVLIRYMRGRTSDDPVYLSVLKSDLMRLQPSFSEKKYGFRTFKEFIESFKGDLVEKVREEPSMGQPKVYLKDWSNVATSIDEREVKKFIDQKLRYIDDRKLRYRLHGIVMDEFNKQGRINLDDLIDAINKRTSGKVSKNEAKHFLLKLGEGRAFAFADVEYTGNKYTMPQEMNTEIKDKDDMDEIYKQRIIDLVQKKFPGISAARVTKMMGEE
ncbi:MAG: NYN domain-containing protein [Methanomassiliicoccales archaeon]